MLIILLIHENAGVWKGKCKANRKISPLLDIRKRKATLTVKKFTFYHITQLCDGKILITVSQVGIESSICSSCQIWWDRYELPPRLTSEQPHWVLTMMHTVISQKSWEPVPTYHWFYLYMPNAWSIKNTSFDYVGEHGLLYSIQSLFLHTESLITDIWIVHDSI